MGGKGGVEAGEVGGGGVGEANGEALEGTRRRTCVTQMLGRTRGQGQCLLV